MELIAGIPLVGGLLATVLPFLIVLGIVVFVHEYGHYIVGRWCGIHAEVFSVGYGKPIYQWRDKRGTQWQIAILPLGGYVKFLGDENAASFNTDDEAMAAMNAGDRARSFPGASVWKRALTVAAGPVFNFILSAFVFMGLFMWLGQAVEPPTVGEIKVPIEAPYDLRSGDEIVAVNGKAVTSFPDIYDAIDTASGDADLTLTVRRDGVETDILAPYLLPPLVGGVTPFSPASSAGLERGDLILSIDGKDLSRFEDLREVVLASEGRELPLVVLRQGEEVALTITPKVTETPKADGEGFEKRVMIGVSADLAFEPMSETPGVWAAFLRGWERVYTVIETSLDGIGHIIRGAFGAEDGLSAKNINGPVGIAQLSGESAKNGVLDFIQLVALLSTAIGMLNLFPIPILDGGHLVIFAYEAVTGRKPADKVLNFAMSIGFVLLMALMIFATYNDLTRIFSA